MEQKAGFEALYIRNLNEIKETITMGKPELTVRLRGIHQNLIYLFFNMM